MQVSEINMRWSVYWHFNVSWALMFHNDFKIPLCMHLVFGVVYDAVMKNLR